MNVYISFINFYSSINKFLYYGKLRKNKENYWRYLKEY